MDGIFLVTLLTVGVLLLTAMPVSLALLRQARLTEARLRVAGISILDGLEIGDAVPSQWLRELRDRSILFLVQSCPSTPLALKALHEGRITTDELLPVMIRGEPIATAIIPRFDGDVPAGLVVTPLRGVLAESLAAALRVASGPMYFRTRGGIVFDKRFIRSADEIAALTEQARSSAVARFKIGGR